MGTNLYNHFVVWTTSCTSHVLLPFKNFLSRNLEIYIHNPEIGLMYGCFLLLLGFASAVCFSLQLFWCSKRNCWASLSGYIHVFSVMDVNSLEGVLEMKILKTHSDSWIPSSTHMEIKLVDNYCVSPWNKHDWNTKCVIPSLETRHLSYVNQWLWSSNFWIYE